MRTQSRLRCAAILSLAIGGLHGQQSRNPYNVHGTVINSLTGAAIPRALVIVQDRVPRMALTDEDGRFEFSGLRAEPAPISAGKPGFFGPRPGDTAAEISTAAQVDSYTESVVIKLSPTSSIHGRIASVDGDPLEDVPVTLFSLGPVNGKHQLLTRSAATTDEDGYFRFSELPAGQYFVLAGPMVKQPLVPVQHSRIPVQSYGSLFYPGVADSHDATPIQLGWGSDVAIDLSLKRVHLLTLRGQVTGWHEGEYGSLQFLSSAGTPVGGESQFDGATGKFRISKVPPGVYRIRIVTPGGEEAQQELRLQSDILDLKLPLSGTRKIPVILHAADRRAEGGYASVILQPEDRWQGAVSSNLRREGASQEIFLWPPPGKYRVQFGTSPPLHVIAAAHGSTDLLRDPLVVTEENVAPIEVTVAYDSSTLGGHVCLQGRPVFARVLIVPVDPPGEARIALTAGDGKFAGLLLPPGTYRVWAFDRLPRYFREAEAIKPYDSRAQIVNLVPNQATDVSLELLKNEDSDE